VSQALDRTEAVNPPTLEEVIDAFHAKGRPDFGRVKREYARSYGDIRESFLGTNVRAAAMLVRPPGPMARLRSSRKIRLHYDGLQAAAVQPEFEAAIWRARSMERQSELILGGRSRKVLVEMLFAVLIYLLNVLDSVTPPTPGPDGSMRGDRHVRVQSALKSVKEELDRLEAFAADAARKAALRWYLYGLPLGAVAGASLIYAADGLSFVIAEVPAGMVRVCFGCGAVGAVVSVMIRITRGQRLVVDSDQANIVTLLAGSFRPLIGAVFGLALYVFVVSGLVPLTVPGKDPKESLFFAGLAFLAGFSERWAQDTILQSAPVASRSTSANGHTRTDNDPGTSRRREVSS
jgi:hypothetical protein